MSMSLLNKSELMNFILMDPFTLMADHINVYKTVTLEHINVFQNAPHPDSMNVELIGV